MSVSAFPMSAKGKGQKAEGGRRSRGSAADEFRIVRSSGATPRPRSASDCLFGSTFHHSPQSVLPRCDKDSDDAFAVDDADLDVVTLGLVDAGLDRGENSLQ